MCALLNLIRVCVFTFKFWIDSADISKHSSIWVKQKHQPYHLLHLSALGITNTIITGTGMAGFMWS